MGKPAQPAGKRHGQFDAADGRNALAGGGYLYALLAITCVNATVVASARIESIILLARAALTTLLALPVGWLLINLGLEPRVHKYGQIFSGVQFLLGPDHAILTLVGP